MLLRMLSIEVHPPWTGGVILKGLATPLLPKRLGNKRASLPLLPLTEDTLIAISDVHGVPTQGGDNCRSLVTGNRWREDQADAVDAHYVVGPEVVA